jgi:hypothetical protein
VAVDAAERDGEAVALAESVALADAESTVDSVADALAVPHAEADAVPLARAVAVPPPRVADGLPLALGDREPLALAPGDADALADPLCEGVAVAAADVDGDPLALRGVGRSMELDGVADGDPLCVKALEPTVVVALADAALGDAAGEDDAEPVADAEPRGERLADAAPV